MSRKSVGSGGFAERLIIFIIGVVLAAIGTISAWYCYKWSISSERIDFRWLFVTVSGCVSFFTLRGALHAFFHREEEEVFEIGGGGR